MQKTLYACCFAIAVGAGFCALQVDAEEPALFPQAQAPQSQPAEGASLFAPLPQANTDVDPTLTAHAAAVECATALMVEQHKEFANPQDAAFKAGACTGKVQSYMLRVRAENPTCFPKISLEEGISIFVKWAEANPSEGGTDYLTGMRKAFEDAVPCLRK